MGCNTSKELLIEKLREMSVELRGEVAELKIEKKLVCDELDKFSYQETMIGRDLIELKVGLKTNIDFAETIAKNIMDVPRIQTSENVRKRLLASRIQESCNQLFLKLNDLVKAFEFRANVNGKIKASFEVLEKIAFENARFIECLHVNTRFLNDHKAFEDECKLLNARKAELEEGIDEFNGPHLLLHRYSSERLVSKINELNDENAAMELQRILRKIRSLEEAISHHQDSAMHDIEGVLNDNDKSYMMVRELKSIIKEQQQRIAILKNHFNSVLSELKELQNDSLKTYFIGEKGNMLSQIIEKSKPALENEETANLRKLIKKRTFIKNIQLTVKKARDLAKNE